jgi:outer membrane protein OmpA-like peptidoglycan-associated protein
MNTGYCRSMWVIGLMGVSAAAFAADSRPAPPPEPVGLLSGAVIGAFAAGPIGAVAGAGLGAWLGNRVHRASEAKAAEARSKALENDKSELLAEKSTLLTEQSRLVETNQGLSAKLDDLTQKIETARTVKGDAAEVLDGFEGDILFRTGSAEITPDIAHQILMLAQAVAKSPALKVRVDGYADPRGTEDLNMKLSQDRANAVRDLLLTAGISDEVLEVNAYGKSQSVAADSDGYAFERRVRLTLQAQGGAPVAQVGKNE